MFLNDSFECAVCSGSACQTAECSDFSQTRTEKLILPKASNLERFQSLNHRCVNETLANQMSEERSEGRVISGVAYFHNLALFSSILPLLNTSQFSPPARPDAGWTGRSDDLLHSCSMVAHCSDFFQVWARSSLDVFTASRMSPMLSCGGKTRKTKHLTGAIATRCSNTLQQFNSKLATIMSFFQH